MIRIPVRIHLCAFDAAPELNATFDSARLQMLFKEVNGIWSQAGIEWKIASSTIHCVDARTFPALDGTENRRTLRARMTRITPTVTDAHVWNIALLRRFPNDAGGIYLRETCTVLFSQYHRGRENSAVILAHELGHSLGLFHEELEGNLMQAGNPGKDWTIATQLTQRQIESARAQSQRGPFRGHAELPGGVGGGRESGKSGQHQPHVDRLRRSGWHDDERVPAGGILNRAKQMFTQTGTDRAAVIDQNTLHRSSIRPRCMSYPGIGPRPTKSPGRRKSVAERLRNFDRERNGIVTSSGVDSSVLKVPIEANADTATPSPSDKNIVLAMVTAKSNQSGSQTRRKRLAKKLAEGQDDVEKG